MPRCPPSHCRRWRAARAARELAGDERGSKARHLLHGEPTPPPPPCCRVLGARPSGARGLRLRRGGSSFLEWWGRFQGPVGLGELRTQDSNPRL